MASQLFRKRLFGFSLLVLFGLCITACNSLNSLFPETFQEAEFEMSDTDFRACELLTIADKDTLGNPQTLTVVTIYNTLAAVYDTLTADTSDASIPDINTAHDALITACSSAALIPDTTLQIRYPTPVEEEDNRSFAIFTPLTTGEAEVAVIFFLNDHVNLDIMEREGTPLEKFTESIGIEAFGGCTDVIEDKPQTYEYDPQMKLRYTYQLTPGTTYLIRLTFMETFGQSADTSPPWQTYRVVVLETAP
jgi:hypothetical protein